jgi:lipid II:glycine glycyltransferase (peptidoglycan interpeptide bridge formation enzyme)
MKTARVSGLKSITATAVALAPDKKSPAILQAVERAASAAHEIDPLRDSRWSAFVDTHPQASVFHSSNWLRALRAVYGYEPMVVTTCSPDELLTNGLVFCRVQSWLTGRRFVSLPFSDHCEPLSNHPQELDVLFQHMKQQVRREERKYFEIRPISCCIGGPAELSHLVTYYFHSLDLRPNEGELFENFHKDCVQRKIRRAERERLQYEEGSSEDLLQKFYRLLVMTRRRQYLPPQPLAWFRGLIAAFGEDLKIRVVSKEGTPVASILTLLHKKTMVYKYGCSNVTFNNLGGTALLFWRTIEESKRRGCEKLEMGRSDIDNHGLVAFKERWGAHRSSISYWTYPQRESTVFSSWKKNVSQQIVPFLPDRALEAVGDLLYRHVG